MTKCANMCCALLAPALLFPAAANAEDATAPDIIVTASRADLLGRAVTASQGTVTKEEIDARPIYRAGQLFESIPGLTVTIHSGEGKANQYYVRGYNLDHGTDFANFIDDMPVNRPTNAHGQGYSDLNFLIPQLAAGIDFTKGPYYAGIGDFGSVASAHLKLVDDIPTQITATVGTFNYENVFAAGTVHLSPNDRVVAALELEHLDGPFHPPEDYQKVNAALRFSHGTPASDGYSLTALYYKGDGYLTTDQPQRAVDEGLIDRYGTLDPSDRSRSTRASLSAHFAKPLGTGTLSVSAYYIHSTQTLFNNFTHFLEDPVNGDQERQQETRNTLGGAESYTFKQSFGTITNTLVLGAQARYDSVSPNRQHTVARVPLNYCELAQFSGPAQPYATVNGYCSYDQVELLDLAPHAEASTQWTPWLRTVLGLREAIYSAHDHSFTLLVNGQPGFVATKRQSILQPKANLILGPWAKTEFYASYGRGFHSDDIRGVLGTVPILGIPIAAGPTPLLAKTTGFEVGIRSNIIPRLSVQIAAFQQDAQSELIYNQDEGQDQANAPSRRQGVEVSGQYKPTRWIELNTDLSFAHARYRGSLDSLANFGLGGPYIASAPSFIGSFGAIIDNHGPWSGALQWRILGAFPISDGDATPKSNGYSEINLDVGYKFHGGWKAQVSVFNALNSHQNAGAYYYTSRLQGEPAEGVADFQNHPLEPRSARLSLTKLF